ncbi:hypothetical protein L3Q82_025870 [Scortum barcoo]|uniref:Uncharacterized protein n=1 Tax=Scortum barcoo TaxID=214431 RepID=A0ACB8WQD2_9TELE|nr:hypothetical protein L3Q82_025870 [Scortum barcoo]
MLQKKKRKVFFKRWFWPPQSPDLSPTELVWDELDRSVRKAHVPQISSLLLMNLRKLGMQFLAHTLKNLWNECQSLSKKNSNT